MELLGVIGLQNPKCIKRIKQKLLCHAEKSPTDQAGSKLYLQMATGRKYLRLAAASWLSVSLTNI